jgi:hypothetical protein
MDPYRDAAPAPPAAPLRRSWWSAAMDVLGGLTMLAFAAVLFRYVAEGWIGYGITGFLALVALSFLSGALDTRIGGCPRCALPMRVKGKRPHLCRDCQTFVAMDRDQLVRVPEDQVSDRHDFGVVGTLGTTTWPERCGVCDAPATRHVAETLGSTTHQVPCCDAHGPAVIAGKNGHAKGALWFRSLAYAIRFRDANQTRFEGLEAPPTDADRGWSHAALFGSAALAALAAGTYYGLKHLEDDGYEIVPGNLKGLIVWLVIKVLGKKWLAALFAGFALVAFGEFIGGFRPRLRPRG